MKRYITGLLATLVIVLGLSAQAGASLSGSYWTANISSLPPTMTTQKFNVQYNISAIQPLSPYTFTAELFVSTDGGNTFPSTPCATQTTLLSDTNDQYGGSGTFPACISSDGNYTFEIVVTRDGFSDPALITKKTSTLVDSSAPSPPSYAGKTISGDTYTLTFTAPSTNNVSYVSIFASTSKTFQTDSSTQVGNINVVANQTYTFTYTAPDSTIRYFALQAFDTAGNGSTLVGDPGVIITPVITTSTIQNTSTPGSTSSGQVLGSTTSATGTGSGQINAPGESSKKISKSNSGSVLGITKTPLSQTKTTKAWEITAAVIVALIVIYLTYISRTGRSLLLKKRTK